MGSIIDTFHLDWKIMIAQIINFAVVAGVLWYLAIRPLIAKLEERNKTVKKSIDNAKKIEENLEKAEETKKAKIEEGHARANEIINEATKEANEKSSHILVKTEEKAEAAVKEAREKITKEKQALLKDIKKDMAELIIQATDKVGLKGIDKSKHSELINQAIEELKEQKI